MTDDPEFMVVHDDDPDKTNAQLLAQQNAERSVKLQPHLAPPSVFDIARLTSYLIDIGTNLGINDVMQANAEMRIAEMIDQTEKVVTRAQFMAGLERMPR